MRRQLFCGFAQEVVHSKQNRHSTPSKAAELTQSIACRRHGTWNGDGQCCKTRAELVLLSRTVSNHFLEGFPFPDLQCSTEAGSHTDARGHWQQRPPSPSHRSRENLRERQKGEGQSLSASFGQGHVEYVVIMSTKDVLVHLWLHRQGNV